jgi:hypothetical protein
VWFSEPPNKEFYGQSSSKLNVYSTDQSPPFQAVN